jgi:nucleoside-diphosphate-sugar epimerase
MRIVVTGASGNVGTAVLRALSAEPRVTSIVGLARRRPETAPPDKAEWVTADVVDADLAPLFAGADAVVHLAWLIQPGRDRAATYRVNVEGSRRVFEAAAAVGAAIVHASSVGAYGPGPKDRGVDETWPATGVRSAFYARDKADCEALLDALEAEHPELRVVRLRPGLIFQRSAATEIRRLFIGPLLPRWLVDPRLIPVVPAVKRLAVQAVHSDDVADAYRRAVVEDVRGPFNVAAEPVLDPPAIARVLGARTVPASARVLRALAALAFRARLTPTEPGWLDLALGTPLMDTTRAREVLGWTPRHSAEEALLELLTGLREGATGITPPLSDEAGGPGRVREFATGIGARN